MLVEGGNPKRAENATRSPRKTVLCVCVSVRERERKQPCRVSLLAILTLCAPKCPSRVSSVSGRQGWRVLTHTIVESAWLSCSSTWTGTRRRVVQGVTRHEPAQFSDQLDIAKAFHQWQQLRQTMTKGNLET